MTQAVIRNPGEGRTIAVVGDVYRFLATGEDTDGRYALWEAIAPPGGGPPPHVHSREEEGFYVLDGEITIFIGDQTAHRQRRDVRQHSSRDTVFIQERGQKTCQNADLRCAGWP